jgi:hypothetical protein
MTSTIVFESNIVFADLGSKLYDVRAKENVLLINVKGAVFNAAPTSLTVKTTNGVGVWLVVQHNSPKKLLYTPDADKNAKLEKQRITASKTPIIEVEDIQPKVSTLRPRQVAPIADDHTGEELSSDAAELTNKINTFPKEYNVKLKNILKSRRMFRDVAEKRNSVLFTLFSIHVDSKYTYFTCTLSNYSSIAFAVDFLSIDRIPYTKTMRKAQAGSIENISFTYEYSVVEVGPDNERMIVFAVPIQAYDDRDNLEFKLSETGGLRTLRFSFSCKNISLAKSI